MRPMFAPPSPMPSPWTPNDLLARYARDGTLRYIGPAEAARCVVPPAMPFPFGEVTLYRCEHLLAWVATAEEWEFMWLRSFRSRYGRADAAILWCGCCRARMFVVLGPFAPLLNRNCAVCGAPPARIDCRNWHAWGSCPWCTPGDHDPAPRPEPLPRDAT